MNERHAIAISGILEFNPLYLFRWEEPQRSYVILYPEGVVKLNETAATILQLCDGERSAGQIAAELSQRYASADVSDSVYKFLETSIAKGWIRIKS